jgi:hypothetical protein
VLQDLLDGVLQDLLDGVLQDCRVCWHILDDVLQDPSQDLLNRVVRVILSCETEFAK